MRRRLIDPYVLGLLGTETAPPWWMVGGLPTQHYPHTQPTGSGEGGASGAPSGGPNPDGEPSGAGGDGTGDSSGSTEDSVPLSKFKHMEEMLRAADRKREEAERVAREYEDKDKTELEKATARTAELEERVAKQDGELAELRLQNAFLTVNNVKWHDPATALLIAKQDGYLEGVVDQDGKVDQAKLKAKLEQLAGKKKFLVESQSDSPQPPSGVGVGSGGRQSQNGNADEKVIMDRYRTLRR